MHSVTPWAPSGKASPTPTGPTRLSRQNREREAALHPPRPTGALTLQTPPLLPPSRGHGHLGALLERHTVNLPRTQQRGPGEQPVRAAYRSPPHTSRPHARGARSRTRVPFTRTLALEHARSLTCVYTRTCMQAHVHRQHRLMHRQLCGVDQAPLDPSSTTAAAGPAPGTLAVGSGPGGSDRLRVKGPVRLVGRSLCLPLRLDNHPVARGDREEGDNPLPVGEAQVSLGRVRHF